jgi:hypothetical protein
VFNPSTRPVLALLASAAALYACSASAPVSKETSSPQAVANPAPAAAKNATPAAAPGGTPAAAAVASTAAQAADADQTICRRVDVLGSRVRKEKVCKTKKEWELYEISKRETLRGIDRGASGAGADPALGGG